MSRKYHFNSREPIARAVCDRCGFIVAHNTLREQRDFRGGDAPVGTGILVCPKCEDKPQPFFARPIVKNDPVPVQNPRPPSIIEVPVWILSTGVWNDGLPWLDSQIWNDGP